MTKTKTKILAVTGPTASGKTGLAIALAKKLDGEIVSCDSMQIYKGMVIGTAAPSAYEMDSIPHHMIGVCDPKDSYSAADYARDASEIIEDIERRKKYPIVCGGTGLYLDSLLKIAEFSKASASPELRKELNKFAEKYGNEALHQKLLAVDKISAENIHPNNVKRVIRALEIYETTGKPKSVVDAESLADEFRYDADVATINFASREILYERINKRVDTMIDAGLENEVRNLYESGNLTEESTAAQAIGYKEMLSYIKGEISIGEAVELIKKNTRNYAKRQTTWFKRYDSISVVPDDENGEIKSADVLAEEVLEKIG